MLLLVVICGQPAFAQKKSAKLISVELNNAGIEQFVLALEKQTNLHFYYNAAQFDSTTFSIKVKRQPLAKVLEQAFGNTSFQFSIASVDYFKQGDEMVTEALDNLMLTQGWRRFKWQNILSNAKPVFQVFTGD